MLSVIITLLLCVPGPATAPATRPSTAPATQQVQRRVEVFISGNVQGVGFRAFTQREARKLGLGGWVTNLADGRVQAEIQGESAKVDALLERLHKGPPGSRVDKLEVKELVPGPASTVFRIDD